MIWIKQYIFQHGIPPCIKGDSWGILRLIIKSPHGPPNRYWNLDGANKAPTLKKGELNMAIANVLLVDDEVPFVEAMTRRLTKRNLNIVAAYSGEEALRRLEEHGSIEVVILDVKMPGMDGIEALTEIRKKHPLIEIIMLTAHATVESAIDGKKQGAFDYLMKHCDIEHLISKVAEAAAKNRHHENKIMEARMKEITSRMV